MNQKILIGSVIALSLIVGGLAGMVLSPDKTYYQCASKGLISDCVNGVKAEGARCYYNATNTAKYTVCPEGWVVYKTPETQNINTGNPKTYKCFPDGCEI
jgi:hypothetical protein